MPRAKRTDRAEARRRYRASLVEPLETDDDLAVDGGGGGAADAPGRRPATSPARSAGPRPGGSSITAAFRSSFRPVDVRGDLRALPLLIRNKAFLLPVILSGASVAAVPLLPGNPIALTFFQYFAGTAPLGTAFIAGFLAPRASWLIGGLACLATVAFEAIAFSGSFGGLFDNLKDAANNPLNPADAKTLLLNQALVYGVPMGILFASAAAWYKRFLNRASPSRQRAEAATSRRPDGKQPKRNEPRPILARRR